MKKLKKCEDSKQRTFKLARMIASSRMQAEKAPKKLLAPARLTLLYLSNCERLCDLLTMRVHYYDNKQGACLTESFGISNVLTVSLF